LKNTSCFPRAWLSRNYELINDEKVLAEKLKETFDLKKTIYLENNPKIIFESQAIGQDEQVIWNNRKSNSYELEVQLKNPALLFVSDSYYPGWKAFVDSQETMIYRADLAFRAIIVPQGKHKVEFVYDPLSFKVGLFTSLATFLIIIIFLLTKRYTLNAIRRTLKLPLFLKQKL